MTSIMAVVVSKLRPPLLRSLVRWGGGLVKLDKLSSLPQHRLRLCQITRFESYGGWILSLRLFLLQFQLFGSLGLSLELLLAFLLCSFLLILELLLSLV